MRMLSLPEYALYEIHENGGMWLVTDLTEINVFVINSSIHASTKTFCMTFVGAVCWLIQGTVYDWSVN
jgi:hypothetical protein